MEIFCKTIKNLFLNEDKKSNHIPDGPPVVLANKTKEWYRNWKLCGEQVEINNFRDNKSSKLDIIY